MSQTDKAKAFAALHVPGTPVVIYNIWDAGSAKAVAGAGARAIATGSWSVAEAQGFPDGQKLPLDVLLPIATRIVDSTDLPVSIDFEGGYASDPEPLAANITALIGTGAIGLNFEDQVVGGDGLHDIDTQVARIKAVRAAADAANVPLFINARTDLFLKAKPEAHADQMPETLDRAAAYADAGASGFFIPGLTDHAMIEKVCASTALPVNVMMRGALGSVSEVAALGVARTSYGPGPFANAMRQAAEGYKAAAAS
ncbi:isocitrate lyase/phosphoenolpyruvate mutase family protein [Tateyamaria sp. ANG-S1]|uniref:isocitrate lyase/PEP mutase family protein n=1 Tax=Tateyamaria sp. ANG-S1 TaxID=1577905 RepID=UPI00057D8D9D|nr:isocitrate lyase/phosphoenolpyruvate mutase family protein [Tateyamaria sp. ANG-S1]KIC46205.1 phosphonomutase [Tateyamaria sp. ANG-S1]